jgi:2-polyprenyl-3-methyl-5-hydroxy-6-metoxy-1,4-benzoquinol methylase
MNQNSNQYRLNLARYSTHNIIKRNLGKKKIVLDVGCNDGYLGLISNETNDFYGLDYSEDSIKKAEVVYKKAIKHDLNKMERLPWDLKFDSIIMADVLEHLFFPEKVLEFFIGNYLKKKGEIIISLPNVANWQTRMGLFFGNFTYTDNGILDKTHLHLYTKKTAAIFIESCGLKIIKKEYSSNKFGNIIKILPFLSGLLGFNLIFICQKKY